MNLEHRVKQNSQSSTFDKNEIRTVTLNPNAKEFVPSQHVEASTVNICALPIISSKKLDFRNSKAHLYRVFVKNQTRLAKIDLLKHKIVEDKFLCEKCLKQQPSNYARLAHIVPLKTLWLNFEKEFCVEMEPDHPSWKENGLLREQWKYYHQQNAILKLTCKDCETLM